MNFAGGLEHGFATSISFLGLPQAEVRCGLDRVFSLLGSRRVHDARRLRVAFLHTVRHDFSRSPHYGSRHTPLEMSAVGEDLFLFLNLNACNVKNGPQQYPSRRCVI